MAGITRKRRGRPRVRRWSKEEIRRFQQALRRFRTGLNYTPQDLENALGYRSKGKLVRMLEGEFNIVRQPSRRFLERLKAFQAMNPTPKKPWQARIEPVVRGKAVPVDRIDSTPRQCLECLAQIAEGRRSGKPEWWWPFPSTAWFWPHHPQALNCRRHKEEARRRRRWFRRCRKLGCPHVVEIRASDGATTFSCGADSCSLRRKKWPWKTRLPLPGEKAPEKG